MHPDTDTNALPATCRSVESLRRPIVRQNLRLRHIVASGVASGGRKPAPVNCAYRWQAHSHSTRMGHHSNRQPPRHRLGWHIGIAIPASALHDNPLEILNRVESALGSQLVAYAWLRSFFRDCCCDQGRHLLESIRGQFAALVQRVPSASLTHDPLVVTQMQSVQYVLGAFPELDGNRARNPFRRRCGSRDTRRPSLCRRWSQVRPPCFPASHSGRWTECSPRVRGSSPEAWSHGDSLNPEPSWIRSSLCPQPTGPHSMIFLERLEWTTTLRMQRL